MDTDIRCFDCHEAVNLEKPHIRVPVKNKVAVLHIGCGGEKTSANPVANTQKAKKIKKKNLVKKINLKWVRDKLGNFNTVRDHYIFEELSQNELIKALKIADEHKLKTTKDLSSYLYFEIADKKYDEFPGLPEFNYEMFETGHGEAFDFFKIGKNYVVIYNRGEKSHKIYVFDVKKQAENFLVDEMKKKTKKAVMRILEKLRKVCNEKDIEKRMQNIENLMFNHTAKIVGWGAWDAITIEYKGEKWLLKPKDNKAIKIKI